MKKTNKNSIKTVILCGGLGTRIFEETKTKPKPMIKLGDKPILHHIIEIYKKYGFNVELHKINLRSKTWGKFLVNKTVPKKCKVINMDSRKFYDQSFLYNFFFYTN